MSSGRSVSYALDLPGCLWLHTLSDPSIWRTRILQDAAPAGVKVLPSPVWRIGPGQVPEPDVVVAAVDALGDIAVEGTPMLVVEVLLCKLVCKPARFETRGGGRIG